MNGTGQPAIKNKYRAGPLGFIAYTLAGPVIFI